MKLATAAIAAICLLLTACKHDRAPESFDRTANGYEVVKLFTHDGCTVYRFFDSSNDRYFTKCQGAAADTTWQESCGKNCSRKQSITTEPAE